MNAMGAGSEPPGVPEGLMQDALELAGNMGVSVEEAQVFLAELDRFGRIVGRLRDRYPEHFAHAEVRYTPPSFLVRFVGDVPPGVEEAFAGLSYPVWLSGDGVVSEVELERLQDRIWKLLMAEGITNHMTAADTDKGLVRITIPAGFVPSSDALRDLLTSSSVIVAATDLPVWGPGSGGRTTPA